MCVSCSLTFHLETKMLWCQTLSRKKKAIMFTNMTANAYQGQLNAGFSKVCKIFKVCVLESHLVSYCIASLVNVGRLLGHLLWLTGKCVELIWSSILLDGYKKLSLPRQPSCEALLVCRAKSVKTIDSTGRLHRVGTPARDISIAFHLSSFLLLVSLRTVLVFITNSYYV